MNHGLKLTLTGLKFLDGGLLSFLLNMPINLVRILQRGRDMIVVILQLVEIEEHHIKLRLIMTLLFLSMEL